VVSMNGCQLPSISATIPTLCSASIVAMSKLSTTSGGVPIVSGPFLELASAGPNEPDDGKHRSLWQLGQCICSVGISTRRRHRRQVTVNSLSQPTKTLR
jgi:hypothetical protein